jgi:hypothetical protein
VDRYFLPPSFFKCTHKAIYEIWFCYIYSAHVGLPFFLFRLQIIWFSHTMYIRVFFVINNYMFHFCRHLANQQMVSDVNSIDYDSLLKIMISSGVVDEMFSDPQIVLKIFKITSAGLNNFPESVVVKFLEKGVTLATHMPQAMNKMMHTMSQVLN